MSVASRLTTTFRDDTATTAPDVYDGRGIEKMTVEKCRSRGGENDNVQ